MDKKLVEFTVFGQKLYLNGENGDISDDKEFLLTHGINYDKDEFIRNFKTTNYSFCLNISNSCNLRCSYCFNPNKTNYLMTKENAFNYLDYLFSVFNDGEKYFVDLSGKGEPLLNKKLISDISKYCLLKSDELGVEVTPTLVTNGTLLTEENVKFLQENRILFGVSLDGPKNVHDKYRKDVFGNPTYDLILKNILNIKSREYVGVAATLTNEVFDLSEEIYSLSKIFNTISYRPARGDGYRIDISSVNSWIKQYEKLTLKLLEDIKTSNPKVFYCLLNGDDFYGRFLMKMFGNLRTGNRCDYLVKRFAVDFDGKIYGCPAATMKHSLGFTKITKEISKKEIIKQFSMCLNCPYKYICGGECQLESSDSGAKHFELCTLKQKVIQLTSYLKIYCLYNNPDFYQLLNDFCVQKLLRNKKDPELAKFMKDNPELKFSQAKKIFDAKVKRY